MEQQEKERLLYLYRRFLKAMQYYTLFISEHRVSNLQQMLIANTVARIEVIVSILLEENSKPVPKGYEEHFNLNHFERLLDNIENYLVILQREKEQENAKMENI
jgi:replicative superfamily II helicase